MDTIKHTYKTRLGYKFPVKCALVTPVHIGGSDSLSTLSDFIVENQRLYLLDRDKLSSLLLQKGQTEAFINMVEKAATENDQIKSKLLGNFLRNSLKVDLSHNITTVSYPAFLSGNTLDVQECITTDDHPYLPGSSIKGAIRTAMLFGWLSGEDEKGKVAFSAWIEEMNLMYKNNVPVRSKGALLEGKFKELVEEKFFGGLLQEKRLGMSCFRVSDSGLFNISEISIYEITRWNLQTGQYSMPELKQCVEKNAVGTFEICLNFERSDPLGQESYPEILSGYTDPVKLCSVINEYSRAVLNYEIGVMESGLVGSASLQKYENLLRDLHYEIENTDKLTAYLRLGAGKLQFYQTIAMILFERCGRDENHDDWITYLTYCDNFREAGVSSPYPITRTLTSIGQIPLGWVKISIL